MDEELIRALLTARKALVDAHQRELFEIDRRIFAAMGQTVSTPPPPPVARPLPVPLPAPVVSTPPPAEPDPPPEFATKSEYLLWYIEAHQGEIDFYETSRALYGSDSEKNRMRVTRILYELQRRMRLKRIGPNTFKLI